MISDGVLRTVSETDADELISHGVVCEDDAGQEDEMEESSVGKHKMRKDSLFS